MAIRRALQAIGAEPHKISAICIPETILLKILAITKAIAAINKAEPFTALIASAVFHKQASLLRH
jgi:hypothetical protein